MTSVEHIPLFSDVLIVTFQSSAMVLRARRLVLAAILEETLELDAPESIPDPTI